ncbi:MAG: hypothetical protein PHF84_04405 [bacterium]|nr:hypothetical protein [bacterium]
MNRGILTGWMGDFPNLLIDMGWKDNPVTGKTCIRLTYAPGKPQSVNWAGLALQQNPENYWGSLRGGYDLTRAKRLFFYARGEKGGERVEFKMGRMKKQYEKSSSGTTGVISLTRDWKLYELDLSKLKLEEMAGGFCIILSREAGVDPRSIYLDEIYFSNEVTPMALRVDKPGIQLGKK